MTEQEKNLRVDIVHLREQLLLSENQLFYRLYHLIPSKKKITSPAKKKQDTKIHTSVSSLISYKAKLQKLKKSPFILVVRTLNLIYFLLTYLPRSLVRLTIQNEFKRIKTNKAPRAKDIINFGVIPYAFRKLRQQHLAEELADKGHRVFYIENRFIAKGSFTPGYAISSPHKNVYVVKLHALRDIAIYHQIPTDREILSISSSVQKLIADAGITRYVAKVDYPFWAYLFGHIAGPIIYDCMDDYEGFDITGKHIFELEKKLLQNSVLTLVCSDILLKKVSLLKPKRTLLLKNACEYPHFAQAATSQDGRKCRKTIGFFGAIGEWIDDGLIEKVAKRFPEASIILIGEVQNDDIGNVAARHKNITLLGEKPYNSLPGYLKTFDVCIIPFKVNRHTTLIDPVKLYEYLASGKPVVTTAISEIKRFGKALYYSRDLEGFLSNIDKALSEVGRDLRKLRQRIALENTWEQRAEVLHKEIQKLK